MVLLVTYLVLTIVGTAGVYFIGLAIEGMWPTMSFLAFLALWFSMLWVAWLLAVRLTAPKSEPAV